MTSRALENLKKRTAEVRAQRLKGVRREAPISPQARFGFGHRAERTGCWDERLAVAAEDGEMKATASESPQSKKEG